jgi:hypothetical protein
MTLLFRDLGGERYQVYFLCLAKTWRTFPFEFCHGSLPPWEPRTRLGVDRSIGAESAACKSSIGSSWKQPGRARRAGVCLAAIAKQDVTRIA